MRQEYQDKKHCRFLYSVFELSADVLFAMCYHHGYDKLFKFSSQLLDWRTTETYNSLQPIAVFTYANDSLVIC